MRRGHLQLAEDSEIVESRDGHGDERSVVCTVGIGVGLELDRGIRWRQRHGQTLWLHRRSHRIRRSLQTRNRNRQKTVLSFSVEFRTTNGEVTNLRWIIGPSVTHIDVVVEELIKKADCKCSDIE